MASVAHEGSKIGYFLSGLAQSSHQETDEPNIVKLGLGILPERTWERKNASF
jgi:hypothetical protein